MKTTINLSFNCFILILVLFEINAFRKLVFELDHCDNKIDFNNKEYQLLSNQDIAEDDHYSLFSDSNRIILQQKINLNESNVIVSFNVYITLNITNDVLLTISDELYLKFNNDTNNLALISEEHADNTKTLLSSNIKLSNWNTILLLMTSNGITLKVNDKEMHYPQFIFNQSSSFRTISISSLFLFKYIKLYTSDSSDPSFDNNSNQSQSLRHLQATACPNIKNCTQCTTSTTCQQCAPGFKIVDLNSCVCKKDYCTKCNNITLDCITCDIGYFINENGNCALNSCALLDYCTKCNATECLDCIGDYQVSNGRCELPSTAIIVVIVVFLFAIIIIWVLIIVLIKPKLFSS